MERGVPLTTRVDLVRRAARTLAPFAVAALLLGIVVDQGGRPTAAVLIGLPAVLLVLWLALGRWPTTSTPATQERVLLLFGVVAVLGPLGSLVGVTEAAQATALFSLPVSVTATAFAVPLRTHVVLTAVATGGVATLALSGFDAPGLAWAAALMIVTVAILAGLAVGVTSRALTRAQQDRQETAGTAAALGVVVRAAARSAVTDPQEILEAIATATGGIGGDIGGIVVTTEDGSLRYGASHRLPAGLVERRYEPDEGLFGEVVRTGTTVVVDDYGAAPFAITKLHIDLPRAAVGVPVHVDGELVGILMAARYADEPFGPGAVVALELLADHAGRAIALSRRIDDDRRTLRDLRHVNERQADFVATVSHELRTPVTIVDGLVQTLRDRRRDLDPAQVDQMLERLAVNTAALTSIVTSLLDTALLDSGMVASSTRLDLAALVRASVERLESVLVDHDLTVEVDAEVLVDGDPDLLARVVDNLLTNVQRHTPPGTAVVVTCRHVRGQAVVQVADHGPGIPEDLVPSITRRFVRAGDHHTRTSRGLGIGLALADEVLRAHGSRLEVLRTAGGGATFAFALRCVTAPVPAALRRTVV